MTTTATQAPPTSATSASDIDPVEAIFNDRTIDQTEAIKRLSSLVEAHGRPVIVDWRSQNKHANTIVHLAAIKNLDRVCTWLVSDLGADINAARASDGGTPTHLAIWYRCEDARRALIEAGADIHKKNKYAESADDKMEAERQKGLNIVWLDTELTSLSSCATEFERLKKPNVLELSVSITNKEMQTLAKAHWVIGYSGAEIEEIKRLSGEGDGFHITTFCDRDQGGNGLFTDCLASETDLETCAKELLTLLKKHCPPGQCPLGGLSVHQDRAFLHPLMPQVIKYLSHQIIDVSTISGIARRFYPKRLAAMRQPSGGNHRSCDDVRFSMELLASFRESLFPAGDLE